MSDDARTWAMIHAERKALAAELENLTPEQWATASLCAGWTVGFLAAHVLAGAEQTPVTLWGAWRPPASGSMR